MELRRMMNMQFRARTCIYVITSLIILTITTAICSLCGIDKFFCSFVDISYFDLLTGQIANTLIVLSLTSVLSSDFGQAYWIDIKDTKLITPFWWCFIGITVYLLTAMVFSITVYAMGCDAGVVVSAVFSTGLLIILTFKMISIYFGKEELKKQLLVEYKHMLILRNSSYVSDYHRRLEKYLEEVEGKEFLGKSRYVKKIKKEIMEIGNGLNSREESTVDEIHKKHIENHCKCIEDLKDIDLKIVEYTLNAIDNNDTGVVRENIELLVECENYDTFFNLIEELFEWDEKYTCKTLLELSKKNMAWVIKDKMCFFKQYALQKLIAQSGKLDAVQNLLSIYDTTNLGMVKLAPKIQEITDKCLLLKSEEARMEQELSNADDLVKAMRSQREHRKELKEKDKKLCDELVAILNHAGTKDLRSFYVPVREAYEAYEEKRFEIVNKYITVIITNYKQDINFIKVSSGITSVDAEIKFTFSYVTDEEIFFINQLIEKDKLNLVISEKDKAILSQMSSVTIDNNLSSDINDENLQIFRATLDIPEV